MKERKPGRVRVKLAEMLQRMGFEVQPEDIDTQSGDYRKKTWDLAVWMADTHRVDEGVRRFYQLCSWTTMSRCVKQGELRVVDKDPNHYELT